MMVNIQERLRAYIPKGDGYASEYAETLEYAARYIEHLEEALTGVKVELNHAREYHHPALHEFYIIKAVRLCDEAATVKAQMWEI